MGEVSLATIIKNTRKYIFYFIVISTIAPLHRSTSMHRMIKCRPMIAVRQTEMCCRVASNRGKVTFNFSNHCEKCTFNRARAHTHVQRACAALKVDAEFSAIVAVSFL